MNKSFKIASVLTAKMKTLSQNSTLRNTHESKAMILSNEASQNITTLSSAIVIAVVAFLSFVMIKSIKSQLGGELSDAERLALTISNGDLTSIITVSANDSGSLFYSLRQMQDNIKELIAKIHTMSESISVASSQIAAGNEELSSRTEEQAAALQQTAASMEEISITTKINSENAQNAVQIVRSTVGKVGDGNTIVNSLMNTMNDISLSSGKVSEVITVIESIAFQTNILALNAAVEAARAGEQGRGFAVVANEVRNLAQRCAKETEEINKLIKQSINNVSTGTEVSNQICAVFSDISTGVERASDMLNDILAATQEQDKGISQISLALSQIDSVTQQNSALVEESASATHSMAEQTDNLLLQVSKFKIGNERSPVKKPAVVTRALASHKTTADASWEAF